MGRPSTLPPDWLPLVDKAGGVQGLAEALGLKAPSSVGRIARGEIEARDSVRLLLQQFCKRHKLPSPL